MSFLETVEKSRAFLERNGRVSLGALRLEFGLDEGELEALVEELVEIQQVAVRDGKTLSWAGPSAQPAAPAESGRDPRDYTPRHLAEKILGSKAAIEGERKQVTVLFADVKSSMELSGDVDPEEWHGILDRFFEILTEGVHRFEGTVNQYTGDGVMALFGAPIAHEDHARRACYAALHLQDELKAYADLLRVERGLNFSVRMGLNSGEVVVGRIGDDLRMDYTAQGHTVGLAQRMESLAEPGKALLASDTLDLVEGFFELRDLGETQIRGVETPVRIAELVGVGRMRTRLDRSQARGLSKFVGRDGEMDQLEAALERSLAGDGQVVGVVAEAGAGKSRLCHEFGERCLARGILLRTGTGVAHGSAVPFEPMLRFYREIFGVEPGDSDGEARQKIAGLIAQIAPEELDWLPLIFDFLRVPDPAQPLPEQAPDQRKRAIIELLRRLTAARSQREPAVLVFEDLHWIDPQTADAIQGLVEAVAGTRTLLLVNFRPEFRADWMSRTHYQQMALRPLDPQAAGELLADWLGPDPSLEGFAARVRDRTGGNPFFMEEVVQAQIESGALVGARGRFRLSRPVDEIEVPSSVQSLLASRIDRLGETAKRLLQTAAVLGDECAEPLLARVAGIGTDLLRDRLRELVQGEFLFEASLYPELEYAFKHPLTRRVAYESLLRERRHELHERAAKAIEALAGDDADAQAALLAHHWEEAGRVFEAARWQSRAASRLGGRAGESLYHWRKVVELLRDAPPGEEVEELLGPARAQVVYAASRSDLPPDEVNAIVNEALESLAEGDSPARALTLIALGIVRSGAGFPSEGHAHALEALAVGQRLGNLEIQTSALSVAITTANPWERLSEVVERFWQLDALCVEHPGTGSGFLGARAILVAGAMCVRALAALGRSDDATALAARLRAIGEGTDDPMETVLLVWIDAQERLARGELSAALDRAGQMLEASEEGANAMLRGIANWVRGAALFRAGRLPEAALHVERAISIVYDGRVNRPAAANWLATLVEIRFSQGDFQAALEAAERGAELSRELGFRASGADHALWRGRVLLASDAKGAIAELRAAVERAEAHAEETGSVTLRAHAYEARAEAAEREGDAPAREAAIREAARLHRLCGDEWMARRLEAKLEPCCRDG